MICLVYQLSTEEIPSADITKDLVTAYMKYKVACIQYRKDCHKTSQPTFLPITNES